MVALLIVSARGKDDETLKAPVGLAFWARVSDEVDKKLEAQRKAGFVPFRLASKDWTSGETIWILDVIALAQVRKVFLEKLAEGAFKGKVVKQYFRAPQSKATAGPAPAEQGWHLIQKRDLTCGGKIEVQSVPCWRADSRWRRRCRVGSCAVRQLRRWAVDAWSLDFTKWVANDEAYFRLKVHLTYKGEPQDFDIVVGCNVRRITYKDNSRTYEAGLTPTVYGRRMSDGKGLVIRAPNACSGQTTANGRVPADFMPVVLVYDDADTLAFGTAYFSDDAYGSPLSELKFGGATIEDASRREFDTFRRDGPPSLVTRNSYHSVQPQDVVEKMGLTKVRPAFGRDCRAYKRFRIPETLRATVGQHWPPDKPTYWKPSSHSGLFGLLFRSNVQKDVGGAQRQPETFSGDSRLPDIGVANGQGGGTIGPGTRVSASFYPATSDLTALEWPDQVDQWSSFASNLSLVIDQRIDFKEGTTRGFAYCYEPPGFEAYPEILATLRRVRSRYVVDSSVIEGTERLWSPANSFLLFYEKDEYFWVRYDVDLGSIRGEP